MVLELVHLVKLTLGKAQPASETQRRYAAIARGASTAIAARAVGIAVGFLAVPLTVRYLGPERYGVWMTVSSTLAWLYLADLGIVNGLTGALARAIGLGDRRLAQRHVATAFWLLAMIAVALGLAFALVWPLVDWGAVFHVTDGVAKTEVGAAIAWAVGLYLAAFPFAILDKIYVAHGRGPLSNLWSAADAVASLLAVVAVTRVRGGLVILVLALSCSHLLVVTLNAAWLFGNYLRDMAPWPGLVSRASARMVGATGTRFFLIQIVGLVLFSTDNIIIARMLGPAAVTPYSVAARLFTLPMLFVTLHAPYIWPAYAEAHANGDIVWIRRALKLSTGASFASALLVALPLAIVGQAVCRVWVGAAAVPERAVLWWMAAWATLNAPATALSMMLNGVDQLRGQLIYGSAAGAVNIWLSIWWARSFGSSGVIAATFVSYLTCVAIPASLEVRLTLRRLGRAATA